MKTAEQIVNGLMNYADAEIMAKLPTSGKWVVGTAITMASGRINNVVEIMISNPVVHMLGIVDSEGNVNESELIMALKQNADKYGSVSVEVPLVGKLTFTSNDIERLQAYL